ncbi:DMT family transporter [Tateyamaria omphalii]|uniref:DMT family transporter n=1 Tax=Tateyamaria omphalii TaxID=299262 RepID=UPI001C99164E|nr:DMT family transporter [Tateyamaria omphalii]MBY5932347.1 DMT family transporter [Tateyamaria omphalii]
MATETENGVAAPALAAMSAALFFGASVVATRFVVGETGAVTLAFLRFAIGTACIASIAVVTSGVGIRRKDIPATLALGALFFGVFPWLFSQSLLFIPASVGAIILATMPVLTLVMAALVGIEALTRNKLIGTGLAFAGVAIAVASPGSFAGMTGVDLWIGAALMLATSLCGAIYNVFSRPFLQRNNSIAFTTVSMMSGAAFLLPFAAFEAAMVGLPAISTSGLLAVLFLGTLGGGIGFYLWIWALQRTTPTKVAIFVTLNPIAAIGLAVLLLGEPFRPIIALGLVLVLAGIVCVSVPMRAKGPAA